MPHYRTTPSCRHAGVQLHHNRTQQCSHLGHTHIPLHQPTWHKPNHIAQKSSTRNCSTRNCSTPLATSSDGPIVLQSPLAEGESLREWVEFNGGYVHPSLVLVADPPCGASRGVIATATIPPVVDDATGDVDAAPVIAIPERLLLTSQDARAAMSLRLRKAKHPNVSAVEEIDPAIQLGMLLYGEKSKGRASFYWPYVESLPAQPPCPWLLDTEEEMCDAIQQAAGEHMVPQWLPMVKQAREAIDLQIQVVLQVYGEVLDELSHEGVRWATAQVLSRCFGQDQDIALLPFIDLCNHSCRAEAPDGRAEDTPGSDQPPMQDVFACVFAVQDGQAIALQPGQEMMISYQVASGASPLNAFLNFGYLPEELAHAPEIQP